MKLKRLRYYSDFIFLEFDNIDSITDLHVYLGCSAEKTELAFDFSDDKLTTRIPYNAGRANKTLLFRIVDAGNTTYINKIKFRKPLPSIIKDSSEYDTSPKKEESAEHSQIESDEDDADTMNILDRLIGPEFVFTLEPIFDHAKTILNIE